MGNSQVPRVDEPSIFLTEFNSLMFQDVLGSYKLFKVMRAQHDLERLVVVKLFIHREGTPDLAKVRDTIREVKIAFSNHWLHPHVVPYQHIDIGRRSAILLRQHFARNLYDRMHTRPFLSDATKNWIAFQVLCAVCQAHSVGVVHGDLKTENVFVSSWNHAVLSDFAHFKPLFLPEDDPSEFSFFFESNLNRRRCYLAPERFDASAGRSNYVMYEAFSQELAAMDIFSLGCVLAELFLDGQTIMDLPQLLQYRAKQFDLQSKISSINNEAVQEIIRCMLDRDPAKRQPAIHCLRAWCEKVAPKSFSGCLFPLSVLLLHPIYQQPDMRIVLIRHNFSIILWSIIGPSRIASMLTHRCESRTRSTSDAPTVMNAAEIWNSWCRHVSRHVRVVDEATLHGSVHVAAQVASQWVGEAAPSSATSAGSNLPCTAPEEMSPSRSSPQSRLAHPWLHESCCDKFTSSLLSHWETGYKNCLERRKMYAGELESNAMVYTPFLMESCRHGEHSIDLPDSDVPVHQGKGRAALGVSESDDVLNIVCAMICSSLQHVSNPRIKLVCLDMFEQIAPFTSQATILEQIVPYIHALLADASAKVRARAIDALTQVLEQVEELPSSDSALFMDYIFPQLSSAITRMGGEPVMLLAIARNIGALAQHAQRFAEISVAAAQKPAAQGELGTKEEKVKSFDTQRMHLAEAVNKKFIKELLDFTPVGPQVERFDDSEKVGTKEDVRLSMTMGREIKVALLRNMCILAEIFGNEFTHKNLLPHLISFMNDVSWEVRAAFCEEAASLVRKIGLSGGQVVSEGIIWPLFEEALRDQEERVQKAALKGLATLVSQKVLSRQKLQMVAQKVAPLSVHPSYILRQCVAQVFDALHAELGVVDQFVFLLPIVRPFVRFQISSLQAVGEKLVDPLGRQMFKKVMLGRAKELKEALENRQPLPDGVQDAVALDLIRPYMQSLLTSARQGAFGPGPAYGAMHKDEAVFAVPLMILQSLQYATLNPRCVANRSLQALAEVSSASRDASQWSCAALQDMLHPLAVFSMQAFLVRALCLPPRPRELGPLVDSNGTPCSIYATKQQTSDEGSGGSSMRDLGQESMMSNELDEPDASVDSLFNSAVAGGLPGVVAMAGNVNDKRQGAPDFKPRTRSAQMDYYGLDMDVEDRARTSAPQPSWKPQGALLATLYEYAHQGGSPVVKVDTSDDSRILITAGKEGMVKIWDCVGLTRGDVAVSSSLSFTVPCGAARKRNRLRALRTVRNSKGFTVGCESGDIFLYRVELAKRNVSEIQKLSTSTMQGASAIMCIEQFDTELESLLVYAKQSGHVCGWDIRSRDPCWTLSAVPPWLGVPSSLALGSDGHAVTIGTIGGGLLMYDLRFLAPWKKWQVSTGASIMSLKSGTHTPKAMTSQQGSNASADLGSVSPGVFAALGSDCNEVAFFDVVRGSCSTLFLTEPVVDRPKESSIRVPSLKDAESHTAQSLTYLTSPGNRYSAGCVRSLWLPSRGGQAFLLAGGADKRVRLWSLDPEYPSDAFVVTPQESTTSQDRTKERTGYRSEHVGDVFVVQEQTTNRLDTGPRGGTKSNMPSGSLSVSDDSRHNGTNPNHRDAILDMCTISLQHDILVTAGRDGLVKLWK